jgi:hypothetical protein
MANSKRDRPFITFEQLCEISRKYADEHLGMMPKAERARALIAQRGYIVSVLEQKNMVQTLAQVAEVIGAINPTPEERRAIAMRAKGEARRFMRWYNDTERKSIPEVQC